MLDMIVFISDHCLSIYFLYFSLFLVTSEAAILDCQFVKKM